MRPIRSRTDGSGAPIRDGLTGLRRRHVRYTTELVRIISTGEPCQTGRRPRAAPATSDITFPPRRLALPAADLASAAVRAARFCSLPQPRRPRLVGRIASAWRSVVRRRGAPALGRAPHRRDLAHAQRSARAARSTPGRSPASAIRSTSATSLLWVGFALTAGSLAGAGHPRAARAANTTRSCAGRNGCSSRGSASYREYAARVPRWMPPSKRRDREPTCLAGSTVRVRTFSWRETLFSERGTLIAIAAGYVLLWMK